MITRRQIEIVREGQSARTKGLRGWRGREISARVADAALLPEAVAFLRVVVDYAIANRTRIQPGETLAYGYWLTKFVANGKYCLDAWEYDATGSEFVPGATLTLTYWRDQHATCDRAGAEFVPPRPDQLAKQLVRVTDQF